MVGGVPSTARMKKRSFLTHREPPRVQCHRLKNQHPPHSLRKKKEEHARECYPVNDTCVVVGTPRLIGVITVADLQSEAITTAM